MLSSWGYSFRSTRVFLPEAMSPPTRAAAPEDCTTVSGMSLGPENAPQAKIPGTDVSMGSISGVTQNPNRLSSTPSPPASSRTAGGMVNPTDRTTMWNSSTWYSPSSLSYVMKRFRVSGSSLIREIRDLMKRTPYSSFARL